MLTTNDQVVLCNAAIDVLLIRLPSAVGISGQTYTIKKTDSSANPVRIATSLSQRIDGEASKDLTTQYKYLTVISDGANWFVVGGN